MGTSTREGSRRRTNRNSAAERKRRENARDPRVWQNDWERWSHQLSTRKKPAPLQGLLPPGTSWALGWPLTGAWDKSASAQLVNRLGAMLRAKRGPNGRIIGELEAWLESLVSTPSQAPEDRHALAIECLAWCHCLPPLAQVLSAAPWWELLERLCRISEDAVAIDLRQDPLSRQLLAGELAATLAYQFPELGLSKLESQATKVFSEGIVELLDGEGFPHARVLTLARPLLACWTRAGYLSRAHAESFLNEAAWSELQWFVRQSLRLVRSDGSQILTGGSGTRPAPDLLEAALSLAGDATDRRTAAIALPKRGAEVSERNLPETSLNSEWAEAAVIRRSWRRPTDQLGLTYSDREYRWELNSAGKTVWSGLSNPDIVVNGEKLEPRSEWDEVCWEAADDGDYLELEMRLSQGRKVQRQLFLAREDQFLFVADAVLGDRCDEIDYQLRLPLADGIQFAAEEETREGTLKARSRIGLVLPLSMPEWNSIEGGSLEACEGGVLLKQSTVARQLYVPLFVDLDPRRAGRQRTWRRLTVAESLEIQPRDTAVGFRVQVGKSQWLIYRSLTRPKSRTLLGMNFCTEFVLARFEEGEAIKLIEIE